MAASPSPDRVAETLAPWSILYRGPLSSCNYACTYCPFAKTRNTRAELEEDARQLTRFLDWCEAQAPRSIGVLMTPWGEGLIRAHYREAMVRLSQMPHVRRVAIQTNLSWKQTAWIGRADRSAMALWTTWHPTEVTLDRFVSQCKRLDEAGARYSVGVVGLKEHLSQIEAMREALSPSVYLWVNAYKRELGYYSEEEIARVEAVDPLFRYNARRHASLGAACTGGFTSFSVDGDGEAKRCHFIAQRIGNIYEEGFATRLERKPCSEATCGCHIGYVHMDHLELYEVFGEGLLERIPDGEPWRVEALANKLRARALEKVGSGPLP